MVLELSQQQVNLLHEFLAESIEELHDEILHTDTRDTPVEGCSGPRHADDTPKRVWRGVPARCRQRPDAGAG